MKTVAFSTILAEICQLIGLDRNTLNDKSFNTIRDLTNRRLGTIWDREEWPDVQKYYRVWPGTPITSATISPISILTESGNDLLQEDGDLIWFQNAENTVPLVCALNTFNPRVYLQDFDPKTFQQGKIGDTQVDFINPFFILKDDGTQVSVAEKGYKSFTYTTTSDDIGDYITTFTVEAEWGVIQIQGSFGIQSTAVFGKNPQNVVMIQGQAIGAYSNDPRKTTKIFEEPYIVENMPDLNTSGSVLNEEQFILRFSNSNLKYILARQVAPWIFGSKYDTGTAYSVGSQVYYDDSQGSSNYFPTSAGLGSNGNFWTCIAPAGLSVKPQNPSQFWRMVEIPARFKDFLVNGIAADFMRSEGRAEEAMPLDTLAEMAIQQQIDVLIRQQGQTQRMNMVYTY
jgi:hypothetical protein